jgi:polyisoprenoid-binding protein YceI
VQEVPGIAVGAPVPSAGDDSGTPIAHAAAMTGKLLQVFGVLFVLALVGGSIAGFGVLKDRVKVVVSPDAAATGPDPIAELKDNVNVLTGELTTLQQALGTNFEQLAAGIDERATARHAEVMALQRDLAAVQNQLAALGQENAALRQQLAQLGKQLEAMPASGAMHVASAPGGAAALPAEPQPQPKAAPVVAETPPPAAVAEAPKKPEAAKPKGNFLFGGARFRCDEPHDYEIVPELSRVAFDAKSTLHDFTGVTQNVSGAFRLDFDDPQGAWTGSVRCDATTLKTGVDGRDSNMWEYLDTKNHPAIEFTIEKFEPAKDGVDVAKQTAKGEVVGTMRIRGKQKPVRMPVQLEIDAQKRLIVKGEMPLSLPDYDVPVPSQLGVINMEKDVKVWISLRARVKAGGGK